MPSNNFIKEMYSHLKEFCHMLHSTGVVNSTRIEAGLEPDSRLQVSHLLRFSACRGPKPLQTSDRKLILVSHIQLEAQIPRPSLSLHHAHHINLAIIRCSRCRPDLGCWWAIADLPSRLSMRKGPSMPGGRRWGHPHRGPCVLLHIG